MNIRTMNLAVPLSGGAPSLVDPRDMGTFNDAMVAPCQLESVRVLDVDGALYVLHSASARGAVPEFDAAAALAEEDAEDAAIAALPEALRARTFPGWEPVAVRRAKRAADDAEAEVRALEARGEKGPALAAAKADAEAKRAAVDEAKAGRGKP